MKNASLLTPQFSKKSIYNEPNTQNHIEGEEKEEMICIISVTHLNIYLYIITTSYFYFNLFDLF